MKSTGVTRGQLRPHFAGRPPFLVAALLVGLGILGISYWSLSSQCNNLESELRFALQRKESVEDSMQNQLQSKDETYKVDLQKKEEEILKVNEQIKNKEKELTSVNDQINTLKESQEKCQNDLSKKDNEIGDVKIKLKEVEEQKNKALKDYEEVSQQLKVIRQENENLKKQINPNKNQTNLSEPSSDLDKNGHQLAKPNENDNKSEDEVNKPVDEVNKPMDEGSKPADGLKPEESNINERMTKDDNVDNNILNPLSDQKNPDTSINDTDKAADSLMEVDQKDDINNDKNEKKINGDANGE